MHHYSAHKILIVCFLLFFAPQILFAKEIFVFKDENGKRFYTDNRSLGENMKYIRSYGRPAAYAKCQNTLQKAQHLKPIFEEYSEKIGFDSKLAMAVAYTESCFDHKAISSVGAQGVMQLMPQTAKQLGVSNPYNKRQNIKAGIYYLKQMLQRFNGNIKLALAAYNAGPGTVQKYQGVPPYQETQNYIKKVLKKYRSYLKQ